MHPGGTSCQRHIESIVDEERHRQRGHQPPGQCQQLAVRCLLEPQLHRGDAPGDRRGRDGHRVAHSQEGVVGHQQETEGGG